MTVTIRLPEATNPVAGDADPGNPWLKASSAKNWHVRADQVDELLVDEIAAAIAKGENMHEARALIYLRLTAALEFLGDCDIRSSDSAIYYSMTVHPEWRAASAEFFEKNKIDSDAAFRNRPGARLLRAIAIASVAANGGAK